MTCEVRQLCLRTGRGQFSVVWQPQYIDAFRGVGLQFDPIVGLSDYGDIAANIRGSDLIAYMPKLLADCLNARLVRVDTPIDILLETDLF